MENNIIQCKGESIFEKRVHIILPSNLFSDYMSGGNILYNIIIVTAISWSGIMIF